MPFHDDERAELDHTEYPEPDTPVNGSVEKPRCPSCRARLVLDSDWCPRCGHDLRRKPVESRWPFWTVVAAVVVLLAALLWMRLG